MLVASPTLALVLHLPGGEKFSELWVLGEGNMAEGYPTNVYGNGSSYLAYVGVGNHMGSSASYAVYVKLRNQTEDLPNATDGTPSSLPPLFEWQIFIENEGNWTAPLRFSLADVTFSDNGSVVGDFVLNDVASNVSKPAVWDAVDKGYFYELFIELWIYDFGTNNLKFDNRFVTLWLNVTRSS